MAAVLAVPAALALLLTLLLHPVAALTFSGASLWVIPPNMSTAFTMAIGDVQKDFYKTLGHVPNLLTAPPAASAVLPGTVVLFFGPPDPAWPWMGQAPAACFAGWESHCVVALPTGPFGGYPVIMATGSGDRGAIFAAYSFSELILGVNPWYIINDDPPLYIGPSITIADDFSYFKAPPLYRYRAAFTNDEDLLGGLRRSPTGTAVFDEATWDAQFETGLRLKLNTWLVGTVPSPDEPSVALASRRGLYVIHHHFSECAISISRSVCACVEWR